MDVKEMSYYVSTIIFLVILMFMIIFSEKGLLDMYKMRSILNDACAASEEINQENARLCRKINRLRNDLEYVENIARNEMGMVSEDDMVILYDDADRHRNAHLSKK